MPKISNRGINMPASPIRKLVPFANAAKARGVKVYHLNIGQPDLPSPAEGLEALKKIDRKVLEYSPSEGLYSLRMKLAEYYNRFNIDVAVDDITVTTGGSEALQLAFGACFDPGDEIILPEPAYANYISFALWAGVKIVPMPCNIENGFALPPVSEFEKLITPRTKGILICNPNNPTGYVYTEEELNIIRDIIERHDLYLFSDEVYREFCYTGKPYFSALNLKGVDDKVIVIDSVSKRYNECGIRIGAFVTRNKQLSKTILKFGQARLSPPLIGQIVAEASIDAPQEYMMMTYNEYIERRNLLIDGLNSIPGVFSPMPMGAFYTVASLPVDNADKFCEWCLSDFSYNGATVFMAPATGFYTTPGCGTNQVRVAYVLNKEALSEALVVLREALKAYPGRVEA